MKIDGSILKQILYEKNNKIKAGLYQRTVINFFDMRHTNSELINLSKCFNYMLDTIDLPLNESLIKSFHNLLKSRTSDEKIEWFIIGDYKAKENRVFWKGCEIIAIKPENVKQEMANLLDWFHSLSNISLDKLLDFLTFFFLIHPFQDGNGRLGRLILLRECLKNDIVPIIVKDEQRRDYLNSIALYQQCWNKKPLIDLCKKLQQEYLDLIKSIQLIK